MPALKLLAMLHKQGIEGDDALLLLAQARFQEAGLGAELYPESPEQLRQQLAYCPAGGPCTAHLPRGLNLLSAQTHARLAEFATVGAGRVYGLILHDHNEFLARADDTVAAFRAADHQLGELSQAPLLFIEYAAGLPPDFFAALFERAVELRHVSACIDISHVGIRACQTAYARTFPGVDVCALKTAPDLRERLESIQRAVAEALPAVVGLVEWLASLDKPLHFHLHDGHPLSALSRYGVSDHLSFLQQVPLPFEYAGRQLLDGMFGPAGLAQLSERLMHFRLSNYLSRWRCIHSRDAHRWAGTLACFPTGGRCATRNG